MASWSDFDPNAGTKADWTALEAATPINPVGTAPIQPTITPGPAPPQWAAVDPNPQPVADTGANPFLSAAPPAADPFDVSVLDSVVSQQAATPQHPPQPADDNPFFDAGSTPTVPGAVGTEEIDVDEEADPEEVPVAALGDLEDRGGPSSGAPASGDSKTEEKMVLSRQDTFKYVSELQSTDWSTKVSAARALKFLAFNADAEYKDGLIKMGFLRTIVAMLNTSSDVTANEHAASCMYSMAREHQNSKLELIKLAAPKRLSQLLESESKQLRLNCTAALYALSCAGKFYCRDIAAIAPINTLQMMLVPPVGRNAQDDQMQLFAALLIVNIVHSKAAAVPKEARPELLAALRRAYDDANEKQARSIIALGIKHVQKMDNRTGKLKDSMRERGSSISKRLSSASMHSMRHSSASAGGPMTPGRFDEEETEPSASKSPTKGRRISLPSAKNVSLPSMPSAKNVSLPSMPSAKPSFLRKK